MTNDQKQHALKLLSLGLGILALGTLILMGYHRLFTVEVRAQGGSYTEGIIGTPRFINPVLAQSSADLDVTELVFGSLINVDQDGNISYGIADSLTISQDQKTYTLSIDPDAGFSDGTPISAKDVIFTINKIQSPILKSPLFNRWAGVRAEQTGARELVFELSQPYSDFIYNLNIGVLPEHLWSDVPEDQFIFNIQNIQPIGSGYYHIADINYLPNGSPRTMRLVPNQYASQEAFISELNINFYENPEELSRAFSKGQVDGAFGVSAVDSRDVDSDEIYEGSLPRNFGIFFNTENNKELLDDETRAALSYAIDREALVLEVFNGYARSIDDPMGSDSETDYDPQRAQELLSDAGWKLNEEGQYEKSIGGSVTALSFSLSVPNISEVQSVAKLIQEQLSEIGVSVNLRNYDQADLSNDIIRSRDFDAILFGYVLEKPSDAFAFWHSSQRNDPGLNISVYNNPRVDGALLNIRNQEDRQDDIEAFINEWKKDAPAIFLYSPNYIYLGSSNISIPDRINQGSERFNEVNEWYQRTRHVWKFLVRDEDKQQ